MFNKEEYWKNREAGWRGQGEQPELVVGSINGGTVHIGIKKFKRDQMKKLPGNVLKDLKREGWAEFVRRIQEQNAEIQRKKAEALLGMRKSKDGKIIKG